MREGFDYRQKLADKRTLRMSGNMFRLFGGERTFTLVPIAAFGASRLKLGLDSPQFKLDILDSALEISQLGFSGYLVRGPHFVSTPRITMARS